MADPVADMLDAERRHQEMLGLSLRSAVSRDPERAAEYQRLSRRFRVPPMAVAQDPDALQQHARALDAISAAADSFALSHNLAEKPGFADVSHDDVGTLASIEKFVTAIPKRIKSALLRGSAGVVSATEMLAEGPTSRAFQEKWGREAPLNRWLREYRQGIEASADAARGERHPNWYAEQFLQGVESVPTSAMAAGMALLGSPAAGLGFMGTTTAGQSYTRATDQGVDPGVAKLYALSQGAVEIGTEALPVAKFLGDVKAGSGFFATLAHNLAAEVPGEQAATVLQDLNDWAVLPENANKSFGDYMSERPEAALGTLIATFSGTTGNIALARAVDKTMRAAERAVGGASQREAAAQQAQESHAQIQQLGQLAAASKLRERDPQSFREFVDEAAEGTPVEDIYVAPAQLGEVLNQGGLDPDQQQALAEALAPRLAEAVRQGTDVRIPAAEFATLIAGTPAEKSLLDHIKTDPSGMTRAEAEQYMQTQGEQLQRDIEEAVRRVTAEDQQREAFDAVKSDIVEQLNAARRFTPAVNDAYANMMAAAYATMAERAGMSPRELWSQMPVSIQAQDITGERLDQAPKWADSIDRALRGETIHGHANLGALPGLYQSHGLPAGSLTFGHRKLNTIGKAHPEISAELLGRLPELLASPLAVFPSAGDPNRLVAALDARDANGDPVLAVLGSGPRGPYVASIYGKSSGYGKTGDDRVAQMIAAARAAGRKVFAGEKVSPDASKPEPVSESGPARPRKPMLSLRSDVKKDSVSQGNRGAYSPATDTITLLQSADLSTFLHESGHFFLEMLDRLASAPNAPQGIVDDWKTTLKWFGVTDEAWQGYSLDEKRQYHEKWARGFEAYLYTGKAPSLQLQGVFSRFRSWLVRVYRQAAAIGVQPTPAIRGVFDRMLASEQKIAEVEAAQSMLPMFENREASGMNPDQWREYQRQAEAATAGAVADLESRSLRDMQWLNNARGREVNRLRRKAAALRKQVRAEVAADVMAEPVYRARLFLTKGLLDGEKVDGAHRFSIPEIEALYGDTPALKSIKDALGYGKYGMLSAENGVHPEQIAELFGFTSADHLIRDLMSAEPMAGRIDALTEKRLLEEHGDLNDEQAIDDAANRAVHSDARARFVATELAALDQATGKGRLLSRAARLFADATINRQKVRDLRPSLYEAAAARAGRASQAALAKGETRTAAAEKRNQLINIYSAKAAIKARDEVASALEYFARLGTPGAAKSIDPEYMVQINALLGAVDLRKGTTLRSIDSAQSLAEWIEKQRELGFEPIVTDEVQQILSRKRSYKEMTVEELRGLTDAVKNIEHLGRLKNRLLTAKKDRDFGRAVDRAVSAIRGNAVSMRDVAIEPKRDIISTIKKGGLEFLALHRKFASVIRQMDGFTDGGDLWELFVRPMNAAGDREATMRAEATQRLAAILKPVMGKAMTRKVYIPEIGASMTLQGRLAVALNMGNATNRARILDGDNWTEAQLDAVLSTLTAEQWGVVQDIWDHVNSYWPQIVAKEQRVTGIAPEKVEAEPFTVTTADGQSLTLNGGYYPIKYDADRSTRAEADTAAEVAAQFMRGLYSRASTRRGHTKARVETVKRPVRKDLGVVVQHLSEVIHDLAWHEYLVDANRLLRAGGVDAAIREHYGPETLRAMRNALTDMAAGEIPAANVFERSVNYLRTGATVAGMGWSFSTALLQPLGLTQSIKRIGLRHVARGLSRWIGDAARMENTVAWIYDQSAFMRTRGMTQQREINEIQNRVENRDNPLRDSFFYLIQKLQLVADVPTWIGQYEKSIEAGEDHDRAVSLADQAVLDSQGGGQIKDLAGIQRGGPLQKLWTNFYSYFSTTYNLMAESWGEARLTGNYGRLAVDTLLLTTIPAVLGYIMRSALKGDLPDDPEELAKALLKEHASYLFGMMVGLRDLFQAATGMGEQPAGLVFLRDLKRFSEQAAQGEADAALARSAARAGGVLFHVPAPQVLRSAEGVQAIAEGRTSNPGAVLLGPPREER